MVQGEPESGAPVPYTSRDWMTCACPVGVLFLIIFGISLLTRDLNYLSKNLLKPLVELSDEVETWSNASDPVIRSSDALFSRAMPCLLLEPCDISLCSKVSVNQELLLCMGLILCDFFQFLYLLCAAYII